MNNFFIQFADFLGQFFLFLVAITIFLPFIDLFKKFYFRVKFFYEPIFFLQLILEIINFMTFKILLFVFNLIDLLLEHDIFLHLSLKFFLHDFQPAVVVFHVLLNLNLGLNFVERIVELFVELLKLIFEDVVLFFLFLDDFQPLLIFRYISETLD